MRRMLLGLLMLGLFACKNSGNDPLPVFYGQFTLGTDVFQLNTGGTDAQAGFFSIHNGLYTPADGWTLTFTAPARPTQLVSVNLHSSTATSMALVHATSSGNETVYFGLASESVSYSNVNGRLRVTFDQLTETDATGTQVGPRKLSGFVTEP